MIESLEPATKYFVVIEALSLGGEGPPSAVQTASTKKMGMSQYLKKLENSDKFCLFSYFWGHKTLKLSS